MSATIASSAPRVLRAREIYKTYRDGEVETAVLKGINLDLEEGAFVALMGPSGSGKSSLLSILGTLLRPSSGTIEIAGEDVSGMNDKAITKFRNRTLGFVFQFHHLLPDFTALENVMFPSFPIYGRETEKARQRATYLLEHVGLGHRLGYRATKLSGGQKQRVAVARALMNAPRLVLADEPTGNLDRESSSQLMELLREIAAEEKTSFLISTHDAEIAATCGRTIQLVDGLIVAET